MELLDCIAGLLFFLFFFLFVFIYCSLFLKFSLLSSYYFFSFVFVLCYQRPLSYFCDACWSSCPAKFINGMPSAVFSKIWIWFAPLVPIVWPLRLSDPQDVYTSEVLFLRNDRFFAIHGVRYHAYPIHLTLAFLLPPQPFPRSLSLYSYSLSNQYDATLLRTPAYVIHNSLRKNARPSFSYNIWRVPLIMMPMHSKWKLTAVMTDTAMPALPWTAEDELAAYYRCRQHVSATCRLTAY